MPTKKERFVVMFHGEDFNTNGQRIINHKTSILNAFELLMKILENQSEIKDVVLFIPSLQQLIDTDLSDVLGVDYSKKLKKNKRVEISERLTLHLKTERKYTQLNKSHIIHAIYVTKDMLNKIHDTPLANTVIVVPWIIDDIIEWYKTWKPEVIGEDLSYPLRSINDPELKSILNDITKFITLSTGLTHPSDKQFAKRKFSQVDKPFEIEDVRAWALRHRWTSNGVAQLEHIANLRLQKLK